MSAIKGLDRIRFRGTLRWLASQRGLATFMSYSNILLKDFSGWVGELTAEIRQSSQVRAEQMGIETRYLMSSGIDKEKLARQIAKQKGIKQDSICMFSVVEPCIAPRVKGNKATKKLEVVMAPRKCVFTYHYFNDPVFGFGHVRIQSWIPFNILLPALALKSPSFFSLLIAPSSFLSRVSRIALFLTSLKTPRARQSTLIFVTF